MVKNLEVSLFKDTAVCEDKELQCSICLCEFEGEDEVHNSLVTPTRNDPDPNLTQLQVKKLPCNHYFHPGCIDSWLRLSRACPMCNGDISKHAPIKQD